jgi:hypothetical protein
MWQINKIPIKLKKRQQFYKVALKMFKFLFEFTLNEFKTYKKVSNPATSKV